MASPSHHRDRCVTVLTQTLEDTTGVPPGDRVISPAVLAQRLENAVHDLATAASATSAYSARIRGIVFTLRRCPQLRRALCRGACSANRVVAAEFGDAIPELIDAIQEEDGLTRGLRLKSFDFPPIPALLLLLYLSPKDLCALRGVNHECCAVASGALLWRERTLRDFAEPQARENIHKIALFLGDAYGAATSKALNKFDRQNNAADDTPGSGAVLPSEACHDLQLLSRSTKMSTLKIPAKRSGEQWFDAYGRLAVERRARAAAVASRGECVQCIVCDTRTAVICWATRSMSTVRYAQCDTCGATRVLEQSTGDVPVMAYLAHG